MNWFILKGLYFVELSRQRLVSEMQNMVSKEEVSTLEKKMNNLKVQLDNTLQKLHESEEVVSKERARGENLQIQKEVSASNHRNEKCDFCIYSKTFCEMDKKQTNTGAIPKRASPHREPWTKICCISKVRKHPSQRQENVVSQKQLHSR